ncbi:hypothetical protein SS1G_14325 [Sclerotinia sclerotiorum 1980 UF-70]|uniref:Uncharacterized protein n=1 Tax=Sclerotinia sclerotiorum (strain ATCC 18683 / 1980 / Ss-1) TaxID=665079 RepID=A7F9P4_SCLS1|nr:hypothetical protein SS1G_14325 [Sclerotinia sclerotiorum 1980 UF-70]EDO00455.1 hypothetical protein SS1G_14325 [Sclerotinia sclerotiorum 1980 UF-70]
MAKVITRQGARCKEIYKKPPSTTLVERGLYESRSRSQDHQDSYIQMLSPKDSPESKTHLLYYESIYRTLPLTDPSKQIIANTIEEKRKTFANYLLTNLAEIDDIPFDTPTASSRSITFPDIAIQDIELTILKSGNTAPDTNEIPTKILQIV